MSSPCQWQGLLASWSRGLQIYVLAVFLICVGKPLSVPSPEPLTCGYAPFVPFCSSCGLTENTAVGSALSPTSPVRMLATGHAHFPGVVFTTLRPQDCGGVHLDPLWELWRQFRLRPGPSLVCTCPQSLQLLKPNPSQLQGHLLPFQMFPRHWIREAVSRDITPWSVQLRGGFSSSSSVTGPWGSAVVAAPPLWVFLPMSLLRRLPELTNHQARRAQGCDWGEWPPRWDGSWV